MTHNDELVAGLELHNQRRSLMLNSQDAIGKKEKAIELFNRGVSAEFARHELRSTPCKADVSKLAYIV